MTKQEYNQKYHQKHLEAMRQRSLEYYYVIGKDRIDKAKKKAYMKEYHRTHHRVRSQEYKTKRNQLRREKYRSDPVYREQMKARAKACPSKQPAKRREERLLKTFGLTVGAKADLINQQGNQCPICLRTETEIIKTWKRRGAAMVVDHDHQSKKVRGILCHNCNQGLGQFRDDPEQLARAIAYLNNSSSGANSIKSRPLSSMG
jgi:hypothetical protein